MAAATRCTPAAKRRRRGPSSTPRMADAHERFFDAIGGVLQTILYDNMKTVLIGRDAYGPGLHRLHAGFREFAKHHGFQPRLCAPYRAQAKGKVERFNRYLKGSFVWPVESRLKPLGLSLDVDTANAQVGIWLRDVANIRIHGETIPRDTGTSRRAQTVQDYVTDFGGDQSIRDMAKAYMALPSQSARNKFSYGAWDKLKGVWFEIWINGLLSSPATQMANIFGNAAFQLIQIPERFGAGLIGLARQAMGSKADRVYMGETMADLIGMVQGIGDGWRLAGKAWRTEAPVRDLAGKVEAAQRRMITGANLAPDGPEFLQRGIDYMGAFIRLPGRGLMTMDEFFKAVAYRRELNSQALRTAMNMKRNGSTRDQIAEAMDDIFAGRNAEVTEVAERAAQYSTFTNPVEGLTGQMGAAVPISISG